MRRKPLLALAGAVAGTAVATGGVAYALLDDDGTGTIHPAASARAQPDAGPIAAALRAAGATSCATDRIRVECRYAGRYTAATVLTPDLGMTVETALATWRTGTAQSALGDNAPFSVLTGPNWLITGPTDLVDALQPTFGGTRTDCEAPNGTCH
ncbi:hypothetical protein [Actinomadura atramentaria]|uniref:hypothetical protein n=1 Tax=Actinomadura atramentaria TaxID=1990 RepID=UPI00037A0055|nr:hypothetical protein [Actinomadura atramentaria]